MERSGGGDQLCACSVLAPIGEAAATGAVLARPLDRPVAVQHVTAIRTSQSCPLKIKLLDLNFDGESNHKWPWNFSRRILFELLIALNRWFIRWFVTLNFFFLIFTFFYDGYFHHNYRHLKSHTAAIRIKSKSIFCSPPLGPINKWINIFIDFSYNRTIRHSNSTLNLNSRELILSHTNKIFNSNYYRVGYRSIEKRVLGFCPIWIIYSADDSFGNQLDRCWTEQEAELICITRRIWMNTE